MKDTKIVGVVDRIEGDTSVVEMFEPVDWRLIVPAFWLPEQREGMVVELSLCDRPDLERKRRERIIELQQQLMDQPEDE